MGSCELSILVDETFSVHDLISQLSYKELLRENIIPDLETYTTSIATKRYPSWIYNLNRSGHRDIFYQFESFVEEIVYSAITQSCDLDYLSLWSKICTISPPMNDFIKSKNLFNDIVSTFRSAFSGHPNIQKSPEFTFKNIQAHPNLLGSNWILDVKTTGSFAKIAHKSFLQILACGALAKALGRDISAIGILLPLQHQILWYDISQWDSNAFLNVLTRESKWVKYDSDVFNIESTISTVAEDQVILTTNIVGSLGCIFNSPFVGRHVGKDSNYPPKIPFQIFLSSPQGREFSCSADAIIEKCTSEHQLYVHAPYIINLCDCKAWAIKRLQNELTLCNQVGARGIVVHVGKHKELTYNQGLDKMEENLRIIMNMASEKCPILLETPAGEGTEVCSSLSHMMNFFSRFDNDPRLRICVDTCHVFAAGYDPAYYIRKWLCKYPSTIGLVHFNDSKEKRGTRLDRHYYPGLGYIGFVRLHKVHNLCMKEHIPMITE